jgi:hypothetical protein
VTPAALGNTAAVMSEEALAEREHARLGHGGVADDTALELGGDAKVNHGQPFRLNRIHEVNCIQGATLPAHLPIRPLIASFTLL